MTKKYTIDDLKLRPVQRTITAEQVVAHTHQVQFSRPLTAEEQQLFSRMLLSFYDVVHFSRQFGTDLVSEPTVIFTHSDQANYTFYQLSMAGNWKDLLFAMFANFSYEVVGITWHDHSHIFDPQKTAEASSLVTKEQEP
jgi:hypothetical protein